MGILGGEREHSASALGLSMIRLRGYLAFNCAVVLLLTSSGVRGGELEDLLAFGWSRHGFSW